MDGYEHEEREREERRRNFTIPEREVAITMPKPAMHLSSLMAEYLDERDLPVDLAWENMWYPSLDAGDASPRIVIPATVRNGARIFWQARAMDANEKRYMCPHGPRGDAIVVVWPRRSSPIKGTCVVEGPMDALAAASCGFLGVALMGATPPREAIKLISVMACGNKLILIADKDALNPMVKVMTALLSFGVKARTEILTSEPYKDLAEAPPRERNAILGLVA